ncbi:P-loop containing nucleoside triphosphate hydrolase protein [Bimuria novae-zelandiae CBS 107.79]|uniref:P-loop containing nucleoside triphosphate hydrolase protein n=1 Tax=Bimuria novae-zelandiae CBS 107.79 TaxID=1447943 RepID=A0A6A5URL4_9PLEO|nr:P-loop containing nucleoside triphosphate hydrolase protein [Bimuria novae-zelandiae CBS 107.79]
MNLFTRQIWALVRKNLLIICLRRPISTFIRALAIPLVVVLVLVYTKEFFASPLTNGISSPHPIRSLKDGLAESDGRDIVGFVSNGMRGDVSEVIESLSKTVNDAGKTPKQYASTWDLTQDCISSVGGEPPRCYGAVVFLSSPEQGTNFSSKGTWNYTVRGDPSGGWADVTKNRNNVEIYLIPLQRAVDADIVARSIPTGETSFPQTKAVVYSSMNQASLDDSRTSNFLGLCIYAFGTLFTFTLVGIVYHMTSFVSYERELGMSGLIDTMIPGGSNIRGRIVRQTATYISFALIYFPSWIAVGVVISVLAFPETSRGIPVGFTIFAGLALTSFSLFGASFFKKAQLSGSIMVVIALVFAILPQVLWDQNEYVCGVLSFIFPSATYTYFVTGAAVFESYHEQIQMWSQPALAVEDPDYWRLNIGLHWIFLAVQIVVYPILAFCIEHVRFSTASPYRTFVRPEHDHAPTVTLSSFSKTYKAGILARIFKRRKDVHAVVDMSLSAYRGQILCLLGPNGSGKSTTMNCIAGQHKVTSGNVAIDPNGGLGYAPQNNVIWPDLTVEEHIRIFSDLKCISNVNEEIVAELVSMCDLGKKLPSKAKTLSGGQKRKLQLAMMFAGGSHVCCVDEVSTGLDPISRRRIWEILLAERHRRTIIMTTHFLDEADYLSDNVFIMYKGTLQAEGTSASLKSKYGSGFTIKLPENVDIDVPLSGPVEKETARHQVVFRVATAALVTELVEHLEAKGIQDYQISGPTMEELFLKVTGDLIVSAEVSATEDEGRADEHDEVALVKHETEHYELVDGRPISVVKQWLLLVGKRFRILRRRYIPYFVAVAFTIVGAGITPLLIKSFKEPMKCPTPADLVSDYSSSYREDFATVYRPRILFGPPHKLNETRLGQMATVYGVNNTWYAGCDETVSYCPDYGYHNTTQLKDQLVMVNSYDEFTRRIQAYQDMNSDSGFDGYDSYSWTSENNVRVTGGLWMGDDGAIIAANVAAADYMAYMLNFLDNIVTGVPISTGYSQFAIQETPEIFKTNPLMFMIYYGLIMAAYPAFFTLYPTNERISNVRPLQYSNGIRPVPLWLSHLAFDSIFVLIISTVATGLLSTSTPLWFGLGYIWLILVLYGLTATLLSYVISMFAKSAVTAWFMVALGQVILYFAYFGGLIGVQSSYPYSQLEGVYNALFFGLGVISPAVCLERAFTIGLGQLAILCNGHSAGSIYLFGGPILYLILQGAALFTILLWWDSSFKLPPFSRRSAAHDPEATEMYSKDLMTELTRLKSDSCDLRVESVSKSFGQNLAVDNVTFGVQSSEIFALLGPNGAGKSTIISMIRGDLKPSTSNSAIDVAGNSILAAPVAARANLGVCPQFDSADVLTVNETLRFFARIRGVSNIEKNVSTVIAACGLDAWADQLAQKLSGGTKRKLSLAVALVGNPRVLVLDEPSSALDANAKRNMWRCLQSLGKGRAVVLTTHSMEEADALADRIGIVSSRMLALGDREDLKRRAGDSFHIHLVARSAPRTTPMELQRMKDWISGTFANAKISRETQGGQIRFEVPAEARSMGALIKLLESVKEELGVEFYSVGKATLDEVFENIVRRYGEYTEK